MKKWQVLVVDDEPTNLDVVRVILEAEGHVVTTAPDGVQAMVVCEAGGQAFDLVLMDLAMPNMDGFEATRRLRGRMTSRAVPILIVTGSSERHQLAEAIAAGGDAVIQKPFRRKQLLAAITNLMDGRAQVS